MQIQTHLNKVTATLCDEEPVFLISSFGINQYPILRVVAFGGAFFFNVAFFKRVFKIRHWSSK